MGTAVVGKTSEEKFDERLRISLEEQAKVVTLAVVLVEALGEAAADMDESRRHKMDIAIGAIVDFVRQICPEADNSFQHFSYEQVKSGNTDTLKWEGILKGIQEHMKKDWEH